MEATGAFADATHPDDRARRYPLPGTLEGGERNAGSNEKRHVRPDGTVVCVVFGIQRRACSDTRVAHISAAVDITGLKRIEAELAVNEAPFRFIFESVQVGQSGAVSGRKATRIANGEHARLTGVARGAEHVPGIAEVRTHPDDRARQEELLAQLQRGEIEAFTMDKRDVPPDGETVGVRLIRRIFTGPGRGRQAERAGRHYGTHAAGRGSAGGGGGGQFGHEQFLA